MTNLEHRLKLIHELDSLIKEQSDWQSELLAQREINGTMTGIEVDALTHSYKYDLQLSKMRSYLIMEDILC